MVSLHWLVTTVYSIGWMVRLRWLVTIGLFYWLDGRSSLASDYRSILLAGWCLHWLVTTSLFYWLDGKSSLASDDRFILLAGWCLH